MDLTPGQQLGTYRIIRLLGKGGMGAVYEVEHVQLGVHYALKTFTLERGHVEILKNKFLTEGKVLARLHDKNLVRVFDLNFDEQTGTPYFVMDLVLAEGGNPRTLADVKTEELDEDRILRWFGELAAAIDYIHAQGIVHRDIKLGNVLLTADGHVILSDFGVSRLFSERLRCDVDAVRTMVSEVGTNARLVMGTQGYMAPEVVRGEAATPAADAYSLGVMFVYLLTGIWYEPGSKVFRLLETLEHRWLDVLRRLLADNPAERPANLTALAETLRNGTAAASEKPSIPRRRFRRAGRFAAVVAGGLAFVGLALAALVVTLAPKVVSPSYATPESGVFDTAFSARGVFEKPSK